VVDAKREDWTVDPFKLIEEDGVPVIPALLPGATDGPFLNNAAIWTYGISSMFAGPEGSGALLWSYQGEVFFRVKCCD
jgi:hypothetical protein